MLEQQRMEQERLQWEAEQRRLAAEQQHKLLMQDEVQGLRNEVERSREALGNYDRVS